MDESEAKLGTDSSLIDEETLGEDDLEGVDDELEETEEVEVISVFRLKLLKAQLHSDASNIVMQVDQGLEEFTSQVEKNIEDNQTTIHEMDDAIDKINKWRLNPDRYAKEDAVTCIGPETDVEYDGDSRRQHNITHLIRLADEIMSQTPKVHNIIPNSHADNLQRALDDMKREHTYSNSGSDEDDDADLDYSAISGRQQNNHKAALDVDFNRIDYEASIACQEESMKLQQQLLLQEIECERNISSLVHQLERLNEGLSAAISFSPT